MAALSGNEMVGGVVWVDADGASGAPSSGKNHLVFWPGSVADGSGSSGLAFSTCCPTYVIRGKVLNAAGGTPLVGYTVQLWESTATWDLPRATVVTDALGQFSVTLDDKVFATSARVITFRVLDPNGASLTNPTQGWDPTQLDHLLTLI